jgi:glycosyltransferase involved in cell wall biosynthesis
LEYIIIDGGSTDDSVGIIKRYAKYLKYWVSEPDRGQSHAINKGFEQASGDLLGWVNSDDYYIQGAFRRAGELFAGHPKAGAIIGAGQYVNVSGEVVEYKKPEEVSLPSLYSWLDYSPFMQPSCFFSGEAWKQCGPLDERIHIAMDLDLWFKVAKRYHFVTTPELFSASLLHSDAKTSAFRNLTLIDSAIVILRHGGEREARKCLEEIAYKLSYYETNWNLLMHNPVVRLLLPMKGVFFRNRARWDQVIPQWTKQAPAGKQNLA